MGNKIIIVRFIEDHNIGTLATADENGNAHAATLDFVVDTDLNLLFHTAVISKKHRNISKNPNVCAVFSDDHFITVQYFGVVKELEGAEERKFQELYDKVTVRRLWKIDVFKLFRVEPKIVKYSNYANYPPKVEEIEFKI